MTNLSKKISELTAATVLAAANPIAVVQSGATKKATLSLVQDLIVTNGLLYKSLWSQASTNAPTETVLVDEISGPIVWSYVSPGNYLGTLTGVFVGKVVDFESQFYAYSDGTGGLVSLRLGAVTDDTIQIAAVDSGANPVEAGFTNLPFTLILYPA